VNWSILLGAFSLVFVAELGDKTQLAVLTQTCKCHRPWAVFLGASLALIVVTALGAAGGQLVGQFVPPIVIRIVAALGFIVMGVLLGWEAHKTPTCPDPDAASGETTCDTDSVRPARTDWRAFGSTFGLLFVAEMGDKTQLAVLSLASEQATPWAVFAGGALALVAVTAMGVMGGVGLSRLVPERVLRWVSAGMFVVMGILIGFGVV
jgi:putative Ca2+/H+ antiporter (TMEM165/GDT1 family)